MKPTGAAAPIVLVAHRGDAARFAENSLAAFQGAAELGLSYLELDVQVTADGTPLVLHDDSLARTHGLRRRVTRSTLGALAAAGVLSGGTHAPAIPTLAQFAAWLERRPRLHAFVELKKESLRARGRSAVVAAVAPLLAPLRDRTVVISYDAVVLPMARRAGFAIGYVLPGLAARYRARAERLAPQFLFADRRALLRAGALWPGPWRWAAFEVPEVGTLRALAELGVDYAETMRPAALIGPARSP